MIVAPERWHAYVLYYLNENMSDFEEMGKFLNRVMGGERKLRWMQLDNAAKNYPAATGTTCFGSRLPLLKQWMCRPCKPRWM